MCTRRGAGLGAALAVLCVALTPLASFADTDSVAGQIACPALLMEGECRAYLAELRRARTKAEMRLFEDRYAALLKERFSLCPHSAALKTVKNADDRPQPQRVFPGKKISM
ncbi:MAG: hypothetical protein HZB71_10375 [Betaproteobacteria bacterium]|nr:hypothetical protein [Betaproteobacteria bacterium]